MTNGKFVPLLIIDLPGREEIVQTFVDPYFSKTSLMRELYNLGHAELKKALNEKLNTAEIDIERAKMLFLMMALNPMGMSLYCYDDILKYFEKNTIVKESEIINFFGGNNINEANAIKKNILMTKLPMIYDLNPVEFNNDLAKKPKSEIVNKFTYSGWNESRFTDDTKITGMSEQGSGFTFSDEIINYRGGQLNATLDILDEGVYISIVEKKMNVDKKVKSISLKGYSTMEQRRALVCAHLINRLLMMDKFDIMYKIYEGVTDNFLNRFLLKGLDVKLAKSDTDVDKYCKELIDSNFKAVFFQKKLNSIEKGGDTDDAKKQQKIILLKEIVKNDYYLSPYEGLYINENIAGVIKYLSTHSALIPDEAKRKEQERKLENESKQDDKLDFQKQQKKLRMWLYDIDVVVKNAQESATNTLDTEKKAEYEFTAKFPLADMAYFFYMKNEIANSQMFFNSKPKFDQQKETSYNAINSNAEEIIPYPLFSPNY
jgi:hypothetical protein